MIIRIHKLKLYVREAIVKKKKVLFNKLWQIYRVITNMYLLIIIESDY